MVSTCLRQVKDLPIRTQFRTIREAEHYVEEDNQHARDAIDHETSFAHPERPRRHILSSCQEMREEGQEVADRGQDDERADEISEGCLAA